MKLKNLLHKIIPPCAQCPYKQGRIQTVLNPCPQCRMNGYRTYERFREQLSNEENQTHN